MAAGGPTVTLTFAGDPSPLQRALTTVSSTTTKAIGGLGLLGAAGAGAGVAVAGGMLAGVAAIGGLGIAAAAQSEQVKSAFTGLKDHVVTQVQELAAPFEPVLTGIAEKARSTFDSIAPSLGAMFEQTAPMVDKLASSVLSLVENVMPGLQAIIASASPVIDTLSVGLEGLGPALSGFLENLSTGAPGASAALNGIFTIVNGLLPVIGTLIANLANAFGPVLQALAPVLVEWGTQLAGIAGTIATQLSPFLVTLVPLIQTLGPVIAGIAAAVKVWRVAQLALNIALAANPIGIIVTLIGLLVAGLVYAWQNSETFRNIVMGVWEAVKAGISAAVDFIVGAIGWFAELPGKVGGWFGEMKDWAIRKATELVDWIKGLPGRFMAGIGNLGTLLVNAGRDLLTGLWNGITGAASWLRSKISGFFGSLLPGWAKDFLGIGSPSKVFRDEIGKFIPEGMALGIEHNLSPVEKASRGMADAAMNSAAMGSMRGTPAAAANSGTGVRFSGNLSDPIAVAVMHLIRIGKIQLS